ncbi:hypothetical protein GGF46_002488 [Coemansia sp. RSA 552]|nr:hypothetical protein GGF46_002488 [Coemansia sp. RSA 552]
MKIPCLAAVALTAALLPIAAAAGAAKSTDELEMDQAVQARKTVPTSEFIVELDRPAYRSLLQTHDAVLVEFYANWCAACHAFAPEFNKFAEVARKQRPDLAVARADITKVEYLSSSFMISMLPELVFIRRPAPGKTPEVRYVLANFTTGELLDYVDGGWKHDQPSGGYKTLWCTPTNLCGHVGGLLGELVVVVDERFNPFNIPAWTFMAIIVSVLYLVGQVGIGYLSKALGRKYRRHINEGERANAVKPVYFDEYRSDVPAKPNAPSPGPGSGGATKRGKNKRTKKN